MSNNKLTIERFEIIPLRIKLPKVFSGSYYRMTHRCTILTRVYTKEGIVGEVYNGDDDDTQEAIVDIIKNELIPGLIGKNAFNTQGCWDENQFPSFDVLRDRSLAMKAQACIDSALWDAVGKALGVPLYKMWGGYRSALPVICIGGYYEEGKSLADFGAEIENMKKAGFAGCKFKVGGKTPSEDAERVRVVREAAGDDFIITVDANQGWTTREAIDFADKAARYNLRWFEEPCRWYNDRRGMALVRSVTGIPITAGQSEYSRAGCRDLICDGAIDICNFDASWGGGPTEWMRVAGLAKCFDVQMAHHEEPQISAHLLASIQHGVYLETFMPERDPLFYQLVENRSDMIDGMYQIPEEPGFGLKLSKKIIDKYRVGGT